MKDSNTNKEVINQANEAVEFKYVSLVMAQHNCFTKKIKLIEWVFNLN